MRRYPRSAIVSLMSILALGGTPSRAQQLTPHEGDFVVHDFHFKSGETLPELRLHYMTLGQPAHDAAVQRVTQSRFAGVLFGPGQIPRMTSSIRRNWVSPNAKSKR